MKTTSQPLKLAILLVLIAASTAAAYLFRVVWGVEIIYTHFMYVPIALASMWWGFWGLAVAGALAALVVLFDLSSLAAANLSNDLARVAFFPIVAFFIGYLRGRLTAGQQALRQSEENYRLLIENSLAGVFVYRDHTILFANRRCADLLGCTPESLIGRSVRAIFHEADRERLPRLAERPNPGDLGELRHEARLLRVDGSALWIEGNSVLTRFRGEPAVLVNVYDISQRKQAETKERELSELARKQGEQLVHSTRLAELGEMAAAISHELNQPLTGIRNYARNTFYMVEQKLGSDDEIKENLRLISEQVDRAARISTQMRELTRRSDQHFIRLDLNSIIRESMDFLLPQMKLAEVEVILSLDPELPEIRGERIRLSQVFLNLLTNARQAMEESAVRKLAIRSYRATHPDLPVVIQVADTGRGFSAEEAARLFMPFYTTKKSGHGTGLGLSISRTIIQDHQGTIEASGAPGKGATFTLRLPAAPDEEQEANGQCRPG
jgi:PAS domain S-box-containing protein